MPRWPVLHQGAKSDQARAMAVALNRRFSDPQRDLADRKVKVYDGPMTLTGDLLDAAITGAWALGAAQSTIKRMRKERIVPSGVLGMIRSPGLRTDAQKERGRKRIAHMKAQRRKREAAAHSVSGQRAAIVREAKRAAANYRARPGEYHYKAGGIPNTIVMVPTPLKWRSDCSQLAVNLCREADVPCPGSGTYMYSNTNTISQARIVTDPRPGDMGLYGTGRGATHHVEVYIGEPGCMFIGHGSPPIDSLTPGWPDFFVRTIDD